MTRFSIYIILSIFMLLSSCRLKNRGNSADEETKPVPESYIKELDTMFIENSGIIYWKKMLWTFNDSGGKNELYGMDAKTGNLKITIQISNATNIDWEDIAQNKDYIFVAETGNNTGLRNDLQILRLGKKKITNNPYQQIEAEKIFFKFADIVDSSQLFWHNSYDCEALFEWNDSLFVFTKDWQNLITKAYKMPNVPGSYSLMPIDSFNVEGLVTGVDINSKGKIAMVGYQDFKSFVWLFEKTPDNLFSDPQFINLDMLQNAQTEGICFSPHGDLLISCELTTNYNQQIWKIGKHHFH